MSEMNWPHNCDTGTKGVNHKMRGTSKPRKDADESLMHIAK